MNKKIAIVSIVLIALMSLSLFPAVSAWHTPCSADDELYEEFGPRPSEILIKIYTDYTTELEGFKSKEVDVMDWALDPVDYAWFETNDPNHEQYSTAFYAEFGSFEYDLNCQVMPTMLLSVRQAIAHLIDKAYFINTYLAGMGKQLDSILNYLGAPWYNPAVTNKYNLQPRTTMVPLPDDPADWEAAYDLMLADLGPPVPDPENPGDFMFWWPSPFPTPDPTSTFPPVADGHLLVYARSEMAVRTQQGLELVNYLEVVFPNILQALGKPRTRVHVDLQIQPRPVCRPQVMGYYRYHLYTGGWILNRDPDFIMYYTTGMITKPDLYGQNYVMYANPSYDAEVDAMLVSNSPGSSGTPCDGIYHAWLAQEIMEEDQPVIWHWATAGYKAVLSNWKQVVNQIGFGQNSWWTFMNAYKKGGAGINDVIRYGFAGGVLSWNIIGAQFYWDYEVIGKVYDGILSVNPYNMADDRPWMASWRQGLWDYEGNPATKLTYTVREDIPWQDIPLNDRSAATVGNTHAADGPFICYSVTPVDIAFSWVYQRDNVNSWSGWLATIIDHVALNPVWQSLWPYDTVLPPWRTANPAGWQYNYVQWDSSVGDYDIVAYCNVAMPWLANHWIGGMYQLPMHLWMWFEMDGSESLDTWALDMVYGCGPYILLSQDPTQIVMIPFKEGASYRGITTEKTFWAYQAVRPVDPSYLTGDGESVEGDHTTGSKVMYWINLKNYAKVPATVTKWAARGAIEYETAPGVYATMAIGRSERTGAVVLQPGEVAQFVNKWSYTPLPAGWNARFRVYENYAWQYEYNTPIPDPTITGVGTFYPLRLYTYISDTVDTYGFADIFGGTLIVEGDTWLGKGDGIVNIKDATPIGLNWNKLVSADDWQSDLSIADMNGDGIINIKDATPIGLNWNKVHTKYVVVQSDPFVPMLKLGPIAGIP